VEETSSTQHCVQYNKREGACMANQFEAIKNNAMQVIVQPVTFFKGMEKAGGFGPPVLFIVAMGVLTALVSIVLSIVGLGMYGFGMALASIIFVPVLMVIVSFIVAAILFVIWKLMGSQENYETAFRCYAFCLAITPITTVLNVIPYVGALVGIVWMLYLIVLASSEVHQVQRRNAWIVFGILALLLALFSLWAQRGARQMEQNLQGLGQQMERMGEMTPEEAGEAMGKFLKGIEKATGGDEQQE
jgi:hypothetical protein